MTTSHPQFSITFLVLQCCSFMLISYMTFSKSYKNILNDYQIIPNNENINYNPIEHLYGLKKAAKFGKHYLISYYICNIASYFVLLILVTNVAYMSQAKNDWVLQVYLMYIWLYFGKMYHNEIVQYFKQMKIWKKRYLDDMNVNINANDNNQRLDRKTIEYFTIQKRLAFVVYWLKLLSLASTVGIALSVGCLIFAHTNGKSWNSRDLCILLAEVVLSVSMFANSICALDCF